VAVKDAIDVFGTVTTVGSRARADSPPAARDAACVAAVRRAGGRVVGKTTLTELCWFADGVNDWAGTPANPLDPARVPGGSSSGSAVAVALGEADVALGTDTGGSVRIPAAACGVSAVKTTRGRVPLDGVFPLSPELDTVGPMARDVAGLVTGMALLEPSFTVGADLVDTPVVVRLRLGGEVAVDPVVDAGVDAALDAAGWRVRELVVPDWLELAHESGHVLDAGAGPAHAFLLARPDLLSDKARQYIEEAVREQPERVVRARERLDTLGRTLAAALQGAHALVLPTLADLPPLLEDRDELRLTWLTVPFNVLGWPAVSLPACAPGDRGPVPPSVQLVGPPWSEERLLALAGALERR